MFFDRISLKNFGPFESAEFAFRPGVVNVIVGQNGSGKSQLTGAIVAALIGRPALRIEEDGIGPSVVDVCVREGDVAEHLRLSVAQRNGSDVTVEQFSRSADSCESTNTLKLRLLAAWSNPAGPRLLHLPSTLSRPCDLSSDDLKAAIPASFKRTREWWQLLESGVMEGGAAASGREMTLRTFLGELARRSRSRESLPLIVDEFGWFGEDHLTAKLLEAIAATSQVILLSSRQPIQRFDNTIYLESRVTDVHSLAYYNNLIEQQRPRLKARRRAEWVRGAVFPLPESRTCELKEIKGSSPVAAIRSLVDQYVVAFLNAGHPQEGLILWGIRDEDRTITGVLLSEQDCDEVRRVVTDKLHQITPTFAPTAYRIEMHHITDGMQVIPDLYVVEIRVPAARRALLYATGGGEVYVKTDSGKRRLSVGEIQLELLNRVGVDVPL
ncbi:MAG TPA: RNA-binding domain-containing protein [Steroidobacter sp.]|uniref:RNA-binding domain-containing protein n=1 Tax=Steroidobacter sp. TaxID=1978227 RepID=UPI002ED83EC1